MQLETGKIYEGKVKGITKYGAFVEIAEGVTGMVHISEISNSFVNEIRDHLTENQVVKVKVLGTNEAGKISLSIKKAADNPPPKRNQHGGGVQQRGDGQHRREGGNRRPNVWEPKKQSAPAELGFEDMMNKFKQSSEEKMSDLKRNTDRKNGSRRK